MADPSGYRFWISNPDFRLFKDEDEAEVVAPPGWCEVTRPLVEWGDSLMYRLSNDPDPRKIGFAKWKLLDRYCRLYFRIEHDHRAETNLNNHPCIHQALLVIWQKLEDMELAAAIPELEPPAWILPAGQGGEPEPDGDVVEVNGLVLGTLDRRDERE